MFFFYLKRVKIPGLPFSYKRSTDVPGPRVAAFENPGYDNASGFGTADDGLYNDLPPPVVLSPYEDLNEFGAACNPIYSDIGLEKLTSLDVDLAGSVGLRSDVGANMFGSHPKVNTNQIDINVQGDKEIDDKETGMVSEAGVRKEQENKGQTVLVLENGERFGTVSEM